MSIKVNDEEILLAVSTSITMADAASKLKLHFSTFKRHAQRLGVYNTNCGAKGKSKPKRDGYGKTSLEDILSGKHPQFQSAKLKQKLFDAGLKKNICEICSVSEWNNKELVCELDHIDGDRTNHVFDNLRILCPNCHSQTNTFRFKKR